MSDVAGYIDQIETGGGGGFNNIENVTLATPYEKSLEGSWYNTYVDIEGNSKVSGSLKFTIKGENVYLYTDMGQTASSKYSIEPKVNIDSADGNKLENGVEYTISFSNVPSYWFIFTNGPSYTQEKLVDFIGFKII